MAVPFLFKFGRGGLKPIFHGSGQLHGADVVRRESDVHGVVEGVFISAHVCEICSLQFKIKSFQGIAYPGIYKKVVFIVVVAQLYL